MTGLGAPEIVLIILAVLLLFGYKKLPDASRSLGRSLRIFKGEMKGMKDDDVRARDAAPDGAGPRRDRAARAAPADGDLTAQLEAEAADRRGARRRAARPRRAGPRGATAPADRPLRAARR